jgi:two-component sensor histidine kinase
MLDRVRSRHGRGRGSEPGKARRKLGGVSSADARIEKEVERRTAELDRELDLQHRRVREMGHRIKNNLQTLSALTLLKARRTEDEGARHALLNMAERIGALSTAYRLTDPSGGEDVDASALVSEIAADLVAGFEGKRIALALDVEPVAIRMETAAPLALLVNELIGNILRHGFPAGGTGRLTIGARREGDRARVAISSDSVGPPEAEAAGDAFGRTLCEIFARQIKAELAFEKAAPGTGAVVLLPLSDG